jgi:hypothetical protein
MEFDYQVTWIHSRTELLQNYMFYQKQNLSNKEGIIINTLTNEVRYDHPPQKKTKYINQEKNDDWEDL